MRKTHKGVVMPELRHFAVNTASQTILDAFATDGAVIIDAVLEQGEVDTILAEVMPFVDDSSQGLDDFTGRQTTRTGALVARSPACRDIVMQPLINELCGLFLAPFCDRYQLHLTQIIRLLPGQGSQLLHRDRLAWGGYLPPSIEPQFNTIWALTDFTQENGATQVVPGSNRWADDKRRAQASEVSQATMSRGSVLLYSGSVIHGGGENLSDAQRIGMNITYCLSWLRQEENQFLSCPPDVARSLPEDLQEMLGYTMGSYALGYFSNPEGAAGGRSDIRPPEAALGRRPRKHAELGPV
jgi:hypothetical protein